MGQKFSLIGYKTVGHADYGVIGYTNYDMGGDINMPIDFKVLASTVILEVSTAFDNILEMTTVTMNVPYPDGSHLYEGVRLGNAVQMFQSADSIYWYPNNVIMHTFPYLETTLDSGDWFSDTQDQVMTVKAEAGLDIRVSSYTQSLVDPAAGSMTLWIFLECETI